MKQSEIKANANVGVIGYRLDHIDHLAQLMVVGLPPDSFACQP